MDGGKNMFFFRHHGMKPEVETALAGIATGESNHGIRPSTGLGLVYFL